MTKYKHILLALDLKPEDDNKVSEQAFAVAEAHGAEVSLIHVVEPIFNYGIPAGTESKFDQWESELEETAKQHLLSFGKKHSIPPERQFISIGQIKRGILKTAEQINADLIVVGSHNRHGLSALFMGDTAEDMVHSAKCDVLSINISK